MAFTSQQGPCSKRQANWTTTLLLGICFSPYSYGSVSQNSFYSPQRFASSSTRPLGTLRKFAHFNWLLLTAASLLVLKVTAIWWPVEIMLTACISLLLLALWALNRNLTPLQLSSRTEQNDNGDEDEFESLRDEVQQRDVTLHAVLDSINLGIVAIDTENKFTCFNHWAREILSRGAIAGLKPFRWPENYPMRYALDNSPVAADGYPLLHAMQEEFASDWESLSSEPAQSRFGYYSKTSC